MDTPSLTPALTELEEASSVIIIIASSSIGSTTGLIGIFLVSSTTLTGFEAEASSVIVITSSINPISTIGFTYLGETTAKKQARLM